MHGLTHHLPVAGLLLALGILPAHEESTDHSRVHGMTISCQTWGREWGSEGFASELADLHDLGVNWVAIHPYASIRADGRVAFGRGLGERAAPEWLTRPVRETRDLDIALLIKPHLAYWGSHFDWRGAIQFEDEAQRARFWNDYQGWILELARATSDADAFCIGTELDGMLADEEQWRALIASVREVSDAHLTYAANWDRFEEVPFWDALDCIGVQAYFPLSEEEAPTRASLLLGWENVLKPLRELSERTGKPVVFTELGYSRSPHAARRPWEDPPGRELRDAELQARCLKTALEVLEREAEWLRGAFLWKWFVGEPGRGDSAFYLDLPRPRSLIQAAWGRR